MRKKRAARFHSQSEAPQAPTGKQEKTQEKVSSPQSGASDPGRTDFYMASLPGVQLSSPSVDLAAVTDRPTDDLTTVCIDTLGNVDDVHLTLANNVGTSDYALSSDMGQALSAFYVVKPRVG